MKKLLLAMVLLGLGSELGFAQTVEDAWGNLKELRVGKKIELVDTNFKRMKGSVVRVTEGAIALLVKNQEVTIERPQVMMVSIPPSRMKQILLAMAAGAVLGASAWLDVNTSCRHYDEYSDYNDCENQPRLPGKAAPIFAGVGAGALGIWTAFQAGDGKVLYVHSPNKPVSYYESPVETNLLPEDAGQPEGGNVFAPVGATQGKEALGTEPTQLPR